MSAASANSRANASHRPSVIRISDMETSRLAPGWKPFWGREDGAWPVCVQQNMLRTLLTKGDAALHETIQTVWPLDAEAAFGVLPTRLRVHADPRFSGKGVTIALVDAGFYPHPDLVQPRNRIRAWADATHDPVSAFRFE